MLEKDERDVEDVIGEVEDDKEVEGEGDLSDFAIGSLNIEELLDALLVYDHLSDVLVFVLLGQIERQLSIVVLDVAIAAPHQQLFDNPAVSGHDCEMEGRHSIGEVLLVHFSSPGEEGVGGVLLSGIAGPMEGCAALAVLCTDLHPFVEEVILAQPTTTMRTGESPWAAMWITVNPCLLIA